MHKNMSKKDSSSDKALGIFFVELSDHEISIFNLMVHFKNYVNHCICDYFKQLRFCLEVASSNEIFICRYRIFCHFCPIK